MAGNILLKSTSGTDFIMMGKTTLVHLYLSFSVINLFDLSIISMVWKNNVLLNTPVQSVIVLPLQLCNLQDISRLQFLPKMFNVTQEC